MDICSAPDFLFPMKADIYYPIITQNKYGQPERTWVFDRTFFCNVISPTTKNKEDIKPEIVLQNQHILIGRVKLDIRISSSGINNSMTNILISNIRDAANNIIYKETAGPRNNRGTIYELATLEPYYGPFRDTEYYKIILRRSENQEVTD